jgi:2-keto-4-pentenoate hydratase
MKEDSASLEALSVDSATDDIALAFVEARRRCRALEDFPGPLPDDLQGAYRCQDSAIELWTDEPGGWKVGRIPPALEGRFGIDRLAGPIFRKTIYRAETGESMPMPIFKGGFAAIEAEFVVVIDKDAPADKHNWSLDEAAQMIGDLCIGLEIASSPLATINVLGPTAVVADFGNNNGLIIGPSIRDWRTREPASMSCQTFVDGKSVGTGGAWTLTGGYVRSVQFMLEVAARRGHPMRAGQVIATGQTTGIHDVVEGQTGRIVFGGDGELTCMLVAARPE